MQILNLHAILFSSLIVCCCLLLACFCACLLACLFVGVVCFRLVLYYAANTKIYRYTDTSFRSPQVSLDILYDDAWYCLILSISTLTIYTIRIHDHINANARSRAPGADGIPKGMSAGVVSLFFLEKVGRVPLSETSALCLGYVGGPLCMAGYKTAKWLPK